MTPEEADSAFKRGAKLLFPYLHFEGQVAKNAHCPEFDEGLQLLLSLDALQAWQANWFLGKAYQAKEDFLQSAARFALAYSQMPTRKEVIHEYLCALIAVRDFETAEKIVDSLPSLDDSVLRFDAALTKSCVKEFADALQLLDDYQWPNGWQLERATELRRRIKSITDKGP